MLEKRAEAKEEIVSIISKLVKRPTNRFVIHMLDEIKSDVLAKALDAEIEVGCEEDHSEFSFKEIS